ncbi:MAG: hypothetical protein KIS96_09780 [Bauldia sp.]|nr:hypothetical protein [Bauldia sp.]
MRAAALAVVLASVAVVAPGRAQDGPFGPLAPELAEGVSGVWTATLADDAFTLRNTDSPVSLELITAPLPGRAARTIRIEVSLTGGNNSSFVGLAFGSDAAMDRYYMLVLGPDGRITLFGRDPEATSPLVRTSAGVAVEGPNVFTIRADAGVVEMFLNGRFLGGIEEPAPVEAGFAAWGMGEFALHRYEVVEGIVDP